MACGPNIIYGNAWYRTIEEKHEPIFELRPVHGYVNSILQKVYGLSVATANHSVVAFRQQIIDEEHDGHSASEIAEILYRLLRFRGEV